MHFAAKLKLPEGEGEGQEKSGWGGIWVSFVSTEVLIEYDIPVMSFIICILLHGNETCIEITKGG